MVVFLISHSGFLISNTQQHLCPRMKGTGYVLERFLALKTVYAFCIIFCCQ